MLILAIYCIAVILPHEVVGLFIMRFLEKLPRAEMARTVITVGLGLVGLLSIPFWLKLRKHPGWKQILLFLSITVILVVLTYTYLFVLPTETAHFPQYAMMAILLFPLTWRFDETLIWATLIGAIDEGYQYYILSPERTNYFDFNDVVTDLLGAALGLIFLWAFLRGENKPLRSILRSPAWKALGLCCLLMILLHLFGENTLASLIREPEPAFWTTLRNGIRFHVLRPFPGLAIIIALLLGSRLMDNIGKPSFKLR